MPTTVQVNGTTNTLVHKMSTGISTATLPDVCKTPSPAGPVPIPYPNIAQSITLASGTTSIKGDKAMAANKGSKFALSNGDNAGVAGGVKSSTFMKEATWILYSFDVKLQKKNAARLSDKMFHNAENAANLTGELQNVATADFVLRIGDKDLADKLCAAACKAQRSKARADAKAGGASTKKFQNLMRKNLDPPPRNGTSGILTEVGQKVAKGGGDFIGKWGPSTAGGAPFVKWDIVLTVGKQAIEKGKLLWSNVDKIVEVKFPGDSLTTNQEKMLQKMGSNKSKVVQMKVADDCVCSK